MSMYFDKFQGGIFVTIMVNGICTHYFGENSWWLIDDWENDIINDRYFESIRQLKIEYSELENAYLENCLSLNQAFCFDWLPSLYIDFDSKLLYNNFYDQALEDRLIEGWKGVFIENKKDLLALIPKEFKYWQYQSPI